ncbi:MAG: tetratricopeptide repeat protein, partial [Candidatus Sulfotelmatobacter sp.]
MTGRLGEPRSKGDGVVRTKAQREMLMAMSFLRQITDIESRLFRILVLLLASGLTFGTGRVFAQQTKAAPNLAHKPASIPSPFADAEALLRQGSVEEAKQKIQEQLALHPGSVAGYNLLGIAYSGEKDYADAKEAFQHALQLSPNSSKTRNNLGNLYVAQHQLD